MWTPQGIMLLKTVCAYVCVRGVNVCFCLRPNPMAPDIHFAYKYGQGEKVEMTWRSQGEFYFNICGNPGYI